MKFALHFGNFAFSDPEGARRLVCLAEAAGFDSVFAVEHVVFPDNYTSVYPYAPGGRLPGGRTGAAGLRAGLCQRRRHLQRARGRARCRGDGVSAG